MGSHDDELERNSHEVIRFLTSSAVSARFSSSGQDGDGHYPEDETHDGRGPQEPGIAGQQCRRRVPPTASEGLF